MKAIYVSGPYSASSELGREKNIFRMWELATRVWGIPGAYAICPNCNTSHMGGAIDAYDHKQDYEGFIAADLDLVGRSDALLMVTGWEFSGGAQRERDEAVRLGLPVFYQDRDGLNQLRGWANAERGDLISMED